jgi:hypothetical protein
MAGKSGLLVEFGGGYLHGTRSGRERYDQIAGKAHELWSDPRVQHKAGQAQQVAMEKAGQAQQVAMEKAGQAQQVAMEKAGQAQRIVKEKVGDRVNGKRRSGVPSAGAAGTGAPSGTGTRGGTSS